MSVESAVTPPNFCERCVAESTDKSPKSISTGTWVSGTGRKFYGSALPCAECGSTVRTLWFVFIDLPILPMGSYRYKETQQHEYEGITEKWNFRARRVPMNWLQVLKIWVVGWAIGAAVFAAIHIYYKLRRR